MSCRTEQDSREQGRQSLGRSGCETGLRARVASRLRGPLSGLLGRERGTYTVVAISTQRGGPFIFYVKSPVILRLIPLVHVAISLSVGAYIPLTIGLTRFSDAFKNYPALWWLVLGLLAATTFVLWLAFPSRDAQARLQIVHDNVSFIPSRNDRHFFGEQVVETGVPPQSSEVLVCHSYYEGLPNGYSLIVRTANEPDREIKVKLFRLDADDFREIAEGTTITTGLPVRFVIRQRSMDGTVQETPWTPIAPKANIAKDFTILIIGAVPYLGGIAIGLLMPRPATIVAVGLALWCGQTLAMSVYARKYPTLYSLTTLFTFAAAYGLAFVVAGYILRSG
jgi:hypothetical protein